MFSVGLNKKSIESRSQELSEYPHRRSCRRGMVGHFGSHRGDLGGHHRRVVSCSWLSSGRWGCWGRVLGRCGPVGDSDPLPAGMDRRMGRYRTGRVGVSTHSARRVRGTYGSGLVHINPGSVNVQTALGAVEAFELLSPVILRLRVEPIWKGFRTEPMSRCGFFFTRKNGYAFGETSVDIYGKVGFCVFTRPNNTKEVSSVLRLEPNFGLLSTVIRAVV